MVILRIFAFTVVLILSQASGAAESGVLGFQAWKAARVEEARASLEKLQAERSGSGQVIGKRTDSAKAGESTSSRLQPNSKSLRSDSKVQQAHTSLELAQELTVNDYFVLYLSQLKGRDAFIEAAKKLTPEESADLMMSYLKHLRSGGAGYDDLLPPSAAGLSAPASANKVITN